MANGYNSKILQDLHDSVQRIMKEEAKLVRKENGMSYFEHSLRGTFNLNLLNRAERMDRRIQGETVNSCFETFNRFVNAGGKDEPTATEIDDFCKGIEDEEVRQMAHTRLHENLKLLDKYRPG